MLAQAATGVLIQRFDLISHIATRNNAEPFNQTECKAFSGPHKRLIVFQGQKRFEPSGNLAIDKMLQTALHFGDHIGTCLVINKRDNFGLQRIRSSSQLPNSRVAPHQATLFCEIQFRIRCVIKPVRQQMKLRHQRLR